MPLSSPPRHVRSDRPLLPALLLGMVLALPALPGLAQGSDMQALMNRLSRMETELQTLSRTVYGGRPPPAAASGASAPATLAPNVAGQLEVRLQQLEAEMQSLNGRYEEAAFQIGQLRDQLEKLAADMDFRLSRLEQATGTGIGATPGGPAATTSGSPASTASGSPSTTASGSLASTASGSRGTDLGAVQPAPAGTPQPTAGPVTLPEGTAQEQYEFAFGLLRQADYAGAEQAFRQFLKAHGTHSLAANAQYWLGETLYVRNQFQEAAIAFAEGYQKFPKSNKAADNLLKLAMALGAINQREDACLALQQLGTEYRDASATIRRRADQERSRLRCS